MPDFYESNRALYELLFIERFRFDAPLVAVNEELKIAALSRMAEEMDAVCDALQRARRAAIDRGEDATRLSSEVKRARWLSGVASDHVIIVANVEIRASIADLDAVTERLEGIAKGATRIAKNLGEITSILDQVAKVLKLIGD